MRPKSPPRSSGGWEAIRAWVGIFLKGLFMGAADAIPGVSGGTIALITGIYERLVSAIAAIDPLLPLILVRPTDSAPRRGEIVRRNLAAMDLGFLFVLGLGIATAVVVMTRLLAVGLAEYRALANAFFFGLIAASAVVLYGEVEVGTPRHIGAAVVAAGGAFVLTGFTAGGGLPHGVSVVFATGAITSAAMLLPGISGAAILYVLGQYEYMVTALRAFTDGVVAVVAGGPIEAVVRPGVPVAVFLLGVGLGLLTIARFVRWALVVDRRTTLIVLVSLMVGSLRLPVEEVWTHTAVWTTPTIVMTAAVAAVGGAVVLGLDRYTAGLEY